MSDLLGADSVSDGKPVFVVGQEDFEAAKKLFGKIRPVVAVNGRDTDVTVLLGRNVLLIGEAAKAHVERLYLFRGDSKVMFIDEELDRWLEPVLEDRPAPDPEDKAAVEAERNDALRWARKRVQTYKPSTAPAQDSTAANPAFPPDDPQPDAGACLPEVPQRLLDQPHSAELDYPDSSAFRGDEAPPIESYDDDWPEIVDIFKRADPEPFNPSFFPAIFADHGMDVAERQGVSTSYPGVAIPVTVSAACCPSFRLQPRQFDDSWTVMACLWGMGVGGSGSGKTPAMEACFHALRDLDMAIRVEVVQKDKDYARAVRVWQEQEKDWLQKAKKDSQSVFDIPEPVRETDKRLVFNDINIPSASEFLKSHPRGMFTFVDEGSSWIGGMDAHTRGSAERGYWLSAFNGGPNVIARIQRGEIVVPNWLSRVLIGITPSALRAAIGKGVLNEDGLFQRMLVGVGGNKTRGVDRAPDQAAANAYKRILAKLIEWDGDVTRRFTLSSGAGEAYAEFMDEIIRMQTIADMPRGMGAHLAKFEGLIPRLCLTFQLAECAERGKIDASDWMIPTRMMERVIQYFRWQLSQIEYFWDAVIGTGGGDSMESRIVLKLIDMVGRGESVLKNSDIQNACGKDWDGLVIPERMRVLTKLEECGYTSPLIEAKRHHGMPTRHRINIGGITKRFSHMIGPERERRAGIKEFLDAAQARKAAERAA